MHVLAERTLALEHVQHFSVQVERLDDCAAALPQIVEPITQRDPAQERLAIALQRQ
ncbi:hypothetical protein D3C81_2250650 [compost metagenome]